MQAPPLLQLEDVPAGPPAGTLIARAEDLPAHGGKEIVFTEDKMMVRLLVQRYQNIVRIYENRCPHAGTPLNMFDDKFMDYDGTSLICRTHGALFDPHTGHCHLGPCKGLYLRAIAFEEKDGAYYTA